MSQFGPEYQLFNNRKFFHHIEADNNLSIFNALAKFKKSDEMKSSGDKKKLHIDTIKKIGKCLFTSFYEIPSGKDKKTKRLYSTDAIKNFKGFDYKIEGEKLSKMFSFNGVYYDVEPNKNAKKFEDYVIDKIEYTISEKFPTYKFVAFHMNNNFHYDPVYEDYNFQGGLLVCPYCEAYCFQYSGNEKNIAKFHKHCEECKKNGGVFVQKVSLEEEKPYVPHIDKDKLYSYLLAHNMVEKFRPTRYYITYDFETLESKVENKISSNTIVQATLSPFMVSSTVKTTSGVETRNFCYASDKDFIHTWITFLFTAAEDV